MADDPEPPAGNYVTGASVEWDKLGVDIGAGILTALLGAIVRVYFAAGDFLGSVYSNLGSVYESAIRLFITNPVDTAFTLSWYNLAAFVREFDIFGLIAGVAVLLLFFWAVWQVLLRLAPIVGGDG